MSNRLLLLVLVTLFIGAAHGRASADNNSSYAKELYDRATVHFRLGQFHDAAVAYQRVYELHHDPALLYNIAQSFRLANDSEKALFFYKSYLSTVPDAPNRDEVASRIAELERVVVEQKKAKERPPNDIAPTPKPMPAQPVPQPTTTTAVVAERGPAPSPWYRSPAGISLAAVAVASAVVGGILIWRFAYYDQQTRNAPSIQALYDARDSAQNYQIAGGVVLGVAGAALVGSTVAFVLARRSEKQHAHASLLVAPGRTGALVGVGGSW